MLVVDRVYDFLLPTQYPPNPYLNPYSNPYSKPYSNPYPKPYPNPYPNPNPSPYPNLQLNPLTLFQNSLEFGGKKVIV